MKITRNAFFAVMMVMLMMSVSIAQTINTHIIFIVPSVVSFRVVLPGSPGGFTTGSTPDIMYNSSANVSSLGTTTIIGLNASIRYNEIIGQDDTTGIFNYSNTGNTFLNISLKITSALPVQPTSPGTIRLYAMNRSVGAGAATAPAQPCQVVGSILGANNSCIYVDSAADSMILQNLRPGAGNSTYVWADFLNVSIGETERNMTHNFTGGS